MALETASQNERPGAQRHPEAFHAAVPPQRKAGHNPAPQYQKTVRSSAKCEVPSFKIQTLLQARGSFLKLLTAFSHFLLCMFCRRDGDGLQRRDRKHRFGRGWPPETAPGPEATCGYLLLPAATCS